MNNYTELEKLCKTFTKGFEAIKQYALDFAKGNKAIDKEMKEVLKSGPEQIAMEYEIQNTFLYMIAEVFQNPKILKQLKTKHEATLTTEGRQVLTFWQKNPAFWCYFTVKKHLTGHFSLIEDRMTGQEHTLYSKGVSSMKKLENAEDLSFLCIMQPNGGCLQTVGAIKQYMLPVSDFLFYCSLFEEKGLQAILHKHFVKFFTLDKVGIIPPMKNVTYESGFAWQPFTLPQFEIEDLGGRWHCQTLGSQQRFTLTGVVASMLDLPNTKVFETAPRAMAGTIIRDNATGEMALFTNTEVAYDFLSALLNRSFPELKLPKKPSYFISMALHLILATIDIPVPWKKFEDIMAYREPKEKVEERRKKEWEELRDEYRNVIAPTEDDTFMKDFSELFIDAQITGKPMNIDAICKTTGLDREIVEGIWNNFDNLDEFDEEDEWDDEDEDEDEDEDYEDIYYIAPDEDKVFELNDLPMPDDLDDDVLCHSLSDSEIFVITLSKMEEAHRQFLQLVSEDFATEISHYGMLISIERLFASTFEENLVYPVMNSFIWILQHKGKDWVPARSYAIEMLKWIPSDILHFYVGQEEFIEAFSKFVKRQLCTKGVCSLAKRPTSEEIKRGTYSIKGTDAFYTLLKVREEDD